MTTLPTYGTRDGLMRLGLPPQMLQPSVYVVETVDPTADTLVIPAHGLVNGDLCRLSSRASNGQPGGTSAGTSYRVIVATEDTIRLQPVGGGPALDITSAGIKPVELRADVGPSIDAALYSASRVVDQMCTAHATPFEPGPDGQYPEVVTRAAHAIAAHDLMVTRGRNDPRYAEGLAGILGRKNDEMASLMRLYGGTPVKGATDQTTGPDNGARAASARSAGQSSGWGSWGL